MSDNEQKQYEDFLAYANSKKDDVDLETEAGRDTLYDICIRHKALPVAHKNWNELAGILALGEGKGGEWLRCWTKQRQRENGSLTRNTRLVTPSTQSNAPLPEDQKVVEIQKEKNGLYIERQQLRDVANAFRRDMRNEARVEELKSLIKEAADGLPKLPDVKVGSITDSHDTEAVLMISDMHIGDAIQNSFNVYNADLAAVRLGAVIESTIKYCHLNGVDTLNVINLGDLIDGLIHTSARIEQEHVVTKQIMIAAELLAKSLNRLQEAAPHVVYRSCTDNHSRMVADYHENIEQESFSKLIDWFLVERLKGTKVVFASDNFSDDIGHFKLKNGKNIIFVHGNRDNPDTIFEDMVGMTHEYIDYCLISHFHSPAYHEDNGCRIFVNGSLCGTENYALSKRFFGKASQTLLVFDNTNLIHYILDCDIQKA